MAAGRRTTIGLAVATALMTGCCCVAVATHEHQCLCHEPGQPGQKIDSAEKIAEALLPTMNKAVNCLDNFTGIMTTPFKRRGIRAGKYLRAEICLRDVKLSKDKWPANGDRVTMRGRMVWDCDGFVEIRPRNRGEVP